MSTTQKNNHFSTYVRKRFDFLKDEYGFEYLENALGYVKNELELEFHYGRGEIEIFFFVNRDDDVFRPNVSRSFDLLNIIKPPKDKSLPYPDTISWPLTEMKDVDLHLEYCAKITKIFGKEILMGNMEIFEKKHLRRREKP